MTTYTYSQLEGLWEQAGGSQALAPVMAAIALAESSGNSQAYNASGASGLWQILGAVNPQDQSHLFDPAVNAKEAVLKYKSQGLGAWVTYTSGAYKEFLQGATTNATTILENQNVVVDAGSGSTGSTGTTNTAPDPLGVSKLLAPVTGLVKDLAVALDYFLGMFGRGQGWRLVFTALMVAAGIGAWKCLASVGVVPDMPKVMPVPV